MSSQESAKKSRARHLRWRAKYPDKWRAMRTEQKRRYYRQFQRTGLHRRKLWTLAEDARIVAKDRPTRSQPEEGGAPLGTGDPTAKTSLARMTARLQFSDDTLAALRKSKGLRIRAGTGDHRFVGIWVVVVRDRVFVRSWSVKPNGWCRTLLKEPRGSIQVGDRTLVVRAVRIKSEDLRDAIDRAYWTSTTRRALLSMRRISAARNPEIRQSSSCRCHRPIRAQFLFRVLSRGSDYFRIADNPAPFPEIRFDTSVFIRTQS
jgi:hypothetical protein